MIFIISYDEQNAYLYGLIRRHDIRRKRKPRSERRTCSYKYYVRVKGKEIQVCKKAFASIHGISDKKIRTLCIKHEQNILFPRDNRGRHSNRPKKVTPEIVTLIKHHILKMLSGQNGSDFIKHDKNQGPDVNISKLHKNFLQQHEPQAFDPETDKIVKNYDAKVKSWLYFKVFHEEFKSMDFHTVKRKLSDLRKSLEASGLIAAKKKPTKPAKPRQRHHEIAPHTRDPTQHTGTGVPVSQMSVVTPNIHGSQVGSYMGPQHPGIQQQLHLSMVGLQPVSGPPPPPPPLTPAFPVPQTNHQGQQQQQQPLNLQTGIPAGNELPQQIPLNIHSVGAPYYISLGHMPNLISIPVSSGSSVQQAPAQHTFPAHHNIQQFQQTIMPTHGAAPQPAAVHAQPTLLHGGVSVAYTGGQHNHGLY